MEIFYRKNHRFVIDDSKLRPEARRTDIQNSLYLSVYSEFLGAVNNVKYKDLTPAARIAKINEYAENWLRQKGLL
jgi:hypothetical protein